MNFKTALAVIAATFSTPAMAHTGADHIVGIASGFLHPFSGLDHLLAMVAIGLIAVQLGGPALWRLPIAFVAAMVAGAATAMTGVKAPLVETAILASVIIFGATLIANAKMPLTVAITGTASLAFFHGFAHGEEGPAAAAFGYILGFVASTAILHATGIAACRHLSKYRKIATTALRIVGTLVMGAGLGLAYVA